MKSVLRYCSCLFFVLLAFEMGFASIHQAKEIETLVGQMPHTVQEVDLFVNQSIKELEGAVKHFVAFCHQAPLSGILAEWDQLGSLFFAKCTVLYSLGLIFSEPAVDLVAKQSVFKIQSFFVACLKDNLAYETMLSCLERGVSTSQLDPSHYQHLKAFFNDREEIDDSDRVVNLEKKAAAWSFIPFTLSQGKASYKTEKSSHFSLLSWNICGLPSPLSLIFGGVLPWDMRIEKIIEILKVEDADVICLQEVFDESTAARLQDALAEKYSEFCINIAPRHFGFTPLSSGLCSGLFIASKYPLKSCQWHPYKDSVFSMINRGFLAFKIQREDANVQLITTHLESSIDDPKVPSCARECRFSQLRQVIDYIKQNPQETTLLCGDLNIYWASGEPAETLIKDFFYDPYNSSRNECTFETCTHCDHTGYWWPEYLMNFNRQNYAPIPCILDYVLVFANTQKCPSIQTKRLPMNNVKYPLSDHYPLKAECAWISTR